MLRRRLFLRFKLSTIPIVTRALGWCAILAVSMVWPAVEAAGVAVLYPDVDEPYVRVFSDIVDGIRKEADSDVVIHTLSRDSDAAELEQRLQGNQLHNVIALGNQAMHLALTLPSPPFKVVAGAVLSAPELQGRAFSAVTLAPDPELLFQLLEQLAPTVEVVSVVYHEDKHASLIERARKAAGTAGFRLEAHSAGDAREGAILFRKITEAHTAKNHAIWLLQDVPALAERSVLQSVLRDAWDHKMVVFSSNPSYVKKGALFSLFSDNVKLGRSLAAASAELHRGVDLGTVPSRDLQSVLNVRTAEHLGLGLSRSQRRQFDMVFPRK